MADPRPPRIGPIYRRVSVAMWGDAKVRAMTPIPACGQGLWVHLLCGEATGVIPGLIRVGRAALAEQLGWSDEAFAKAFGEVFDQGMVKADWSARLVWVPKAIAHNAPANPNVVRSWRAELQLLPECDLKDEALQYIKAFVQGMGKAFGEAFGEALVRTIGETGSGSGSGAGAGAETGSGAEAGSSGVCVVPPPDRMGRAEPLPQDFHQDPDAETLTPSDEALVVADRFGAMMAHLHPRESRWTDISFSMRRVTVAATFERWRNSFQPPLDWMEVRRVVKWIQAERWDPGPDGWTGWASAVRTEQKFIEHYPKFFDAGAPDSHPRDPAVRAAKKADVQPPRKNFADPEEAPAYHQPFRPPVA